MVRNTGGTTAQLNAGFTVESAREIELAFDVAIPEVINLSFNPPQSFKFNFQNTGNVDIPYFIARITMPFTTEVVSVRSSSNVITLSTLLNGASLPDKIPDSVADIIGSDGVLIIPFLAKNIAPGEEFQFSVSLRGFQLPEFPIALAYALKDVGQFIAEGIEITDRFRSVILRHEEVVDPEFVALARDGDAFREFVLQLVLTRGFIEGDDLDNFQSTPGSNALYEYNITENRNFASSQNFSRLSSSVRTAVRGCPLFTAIGCGLTFLILDVAIALAVGALLVGSGVGIVALITAGHLLTSGLLLGFVYGVIIEATTCFIATEVICKTIPVVNSSDPNDIIGPSGSGDQRWVSVKKSLPYTIRVENDPEQATAPAQEVTITQELDSTLDARRFRLGDFGFGSFVFEVPDNRSFYTQRLDVRDSLGIFVDVTAGIDVTKNEAFWILKSIDPATGQRPLDPFSGFLPVNDSTAVGQGFVSYTILPDPNSQTHDVIDAKATIVFDDNDPIDTPAIFNTIDAEAPTSRANPLPAQVADTTFVVTWSAQDDSAASGIQDVTLYSSVDGEPFQVAASGITDTSFTFTGEFGRSYGFFTIARDNAGNVERFKTAAEATIDIVTSITDENQTEIPKEFALEQNYPNPFNPTTVIKYRLKTDAEVKLAIYNILGQKVRKLVNKKQSAGFYSIEWDGLNEQGATVASGVYVYRIVAEDFVQTKKMLLLR